MFVGMRGSLVWIPHMCSVMQHHHVCWYCDSTIMPSALNWCSDNNILECRVRFRSNRSNNNQRTSINTSIHRGRKYADENDTHSNIILPRSSGHVEACYQLHATSILFCPLLLLKLPILFSFLSSLLTCNLILIY